MFWHCIVRHRNWERRVRYGERERRGEQKRGRWGRKGEKRQSERAEVFFLDRAERLCVVHDVGVRQGKAWRDGGAERVGSRPRTGP